MLLLLLMFAMMVWWNCCYVYMIYAAQVEYTNRHDKQVNIREELLLFFYSPTFARILDLRGKHLYPLSHVQF